MNFMVTPRYVLGSDSKRFHAETVQEAIEIAHTLMGDEQGMKYEFELYQLVCIQDESVGPLRNR
jgi:hypothetical protein